MKRRTLLASGFLATAPGFAIRRQDTVPDGFPRQDLESVQAVVRFSHFSMERVEALVSARPELAKAAWDWGYGDWETALGAAAHTGNAEIAEYLIEHGAPPTLYSAAALGQLDIVRGMIEAAPGIQRKPGPHGIPLMEHARLAGDRAAAVVEYLATLGDADNRLTSAPYGDAPREAFFGTYRWGPGADQYFEAYDQRGALMLRRGEQTGRGLTHLGGNAFSPAGAPSVRIVFDVENGVPVRVTVHDPDPIVSAVRDS